MPDLMRRWRDRKNKIIHAFDPNQNLNTRDVHTLCGRAVWIDVDHPYGTSRTALWHIPDIKKPTADLPKPSTPLTCMSCLALLW